MVRQIREYKDIFEPLGFQVLSQSEANINFEVEEGSNGFGYDPIFISEDGKGKTTASMPLSFKETYSHRAKAVKKLVTFLQSR